MFIAKYLPVEGEIKEGDYHEIEKGSIGKVISMKGNTYTSKGITGFFVGKSGTQHIVNLKQKVKLFLCSTNLKSGDEVYFKLTPKSPYKQAEVAEVFTDEGRVTAIIGDGDPDYCVYTTPDQYCFKKIGEISSSAKWVKEGMVLDATQLAIKGSEPDNYHSLDLVLQMQTDPPNILYYVECPTCGDYH